MTREQAVAAFDELVENGFTVQLTGRKIPDGRHVRPDNLDTYYTLDIGDGLVTGDVRLEEMNEILHKHGLAVRVRGMVSASSADKDPHEVMVGRSVG